MHFLIVLHANASAVGGALASMAHDAVMTPLDVLKQRMQLGLYARPIDALRAVVRTEGVKALYSSYFTTILMNVPNAAVLVVTNDWMKSILNPSGNQNFSAFLVSGLVAGALSGFVTCPLDVIKTRIQTQNASGITTNDVAIRKYTGFWQTLKLMVVGNERVVELLEGRGNSQSVHGCFNTYCAAGSCSCSQLDCI